MKKAPPPPVMDAPFGAREIVAIVKKKKLGQPPGPPPDAMLAFSAPKAYSPQQHQHQHPTSMATLRSARPRTDEEDLFASDDDDINDYNISQSKSMNFNRFDDKTSSYADAKVIKLIHLRFI